MSLSILLLSFAALGGDQLPATIRVNGDPAPGSAALMSANFDRAEQEIRSASVSKYDPARAINLGVALAMKGDREGAAKQFRRALTEDEVQVVVANGQTESSHDVAQRALDSLQGGVLGR